MVMRCVPRGAQAVEASDGIEALEDVQFRGPEQLQAGLPSLPRALPRHRLFPAVSSLHPGRRWLLQMASKQYLYGGWGYLQERIYSPAARIGFILGGGGFPCARASEPPQSLATSS